MFIFENPTDLWLKKSTCFENLEIQKKIASWVWIKKDFPRLLSLIFCRGYEIVWFCRGWMASTSMEATSKIFNKSHLFTKNNENMYSFFNLFWSVLRTKSVLGSSKRGGKNPVLWLLLESILSGFTNHICLGDMETGWLESCVLIHYRIYFEWFHEPNPPWGHENLVARILKWIKR